MSIFVIADPHLSFGNPDKSMEFFGPLWANYTNRMQEAWRDCVTEKDLVLIPGDISWAMNLEDALIDLQWIDALPGTKVMIKGNHDYWWTSSQKMTKAMPPSINFIYNNVFNWKDITIGGTRLWDSNEYNFNSYILYQENPRAKEKVLVDETEQDEKIFVRELERLRLSLKQLQQEASYRIAMTHYPPIGADLKPSRASAILEEFKIQTCVFGHLHSLNKKLPMFGEARGICYHLTSCDYLDFTPIKIL
jgi:predicted phosphohydrolase